MAAVVEPQVSHYQDYKPTGVEWMPEIPVGWEVMRGKDHLEILSGYPFDSKKFNPLDGFQLVRIRDIDVVSSSMKYDGEWVPQAAIDTGDILIGMDGDYNVAKWKGGPALMNQRVCCVRSSATVDKNFLYYLLPSPLQIINDLTYYTTVKHLSVNDLKELRFGLPSMVEQKAIARFLDDKTAQLDQLITQKQQMLALLREERAALINHAVTKGLDPQAPLRDSGVEWLGEVPAHWSIRRVGYSFDIIGSGTTPNTDKREYYEDGNINWINTGDLNDGYLTETKKQITATATDDLKTLRIYPVQSLIVAMYGATIGKLSITAIEGCTNQACAVLAESHVFKIKFAFYWFLAAKEYIITLASGGGQPNISQELIRSLKMSCPPIDEQESIVIYLDAKSAEVAETTDTINQEIALLQEYRAALIAEAVTGQLDVRHYAPAAAAALM